MAMSTETSDNNSTTPPPVPIIPRTPFKPNAPDKDTSSLLFGELPVSTFNAINTIVDTAVRDGISELPFISSSSLKRSDVDDNNGPSPRSNLTDISICCSGEETTASQLDISRFDHSHVDELTGGGERLRKIMFSAYSKQFSRVETLAMKNVFSLNLISKAKRAKIVKMYKNGGIDDDDITFSLSNSCDSYDENNENDYYNKNYSTVMKLIGDDYYVNSSLPLPPDPETTAKTTAKDNQELRKRLHQLKRRKRHLTIRLKKAERNYKLVSFAMEKSSNAPGAELQEKVDAILMKKEGLIRLNKQGSRTKTLLDDMEGLDNDGDGQRKNTKRQKYLSIDEEYNLAKEMICCTANGIEQVLECFRRGKGV